MPKQVLDNNSFLKRHWVFMKGVPTYFEVKTSLACQKNNVLLLPFYKTPTIKLLQIKLRCLDDFFIISSIFRSLLIRSSFEHSHVGFRNFLFIPSKYQSITCKKTVVAFKPKFYIVLLSNFIAIIYLFTWSLHYYMVMGL